MSTATAGALFLTLVAFAIVATVVIVGVLQHRRDLKLEDMRIRAYANMERQRRGTWQAPREGGR